ncbi:SLAM family member 9-like isoform X4 [Lutra lutra]|uniref:SLAM family member 9-like isoform X4 n=1 Tax=Lutra lutra TaxID=9657 RepID=UPI001FD23FFA|nr:SLAM family member 9-like isoform X4 [Lutra lutra]
MGVGYPRLDSEVPELIVSPAPGVRRSLRALVSEEVFLLLLRLYSGCFLEAESVHTEPAGRQQAMGACSEDPHLCGASWLLRFTGLLLSVCSSVTQSPGAHGSALDDSGNPLPLKGTLGASVWFHMIKNPELPPRSKLKSITWGIINQKIYTPVLQVSPGGDVPRWVNFQDKFEKKVHVLNTTTLRIDNLTLEDSGLYRAQESYTGGRQYDQDFHLMVYEPVPLPQIRATVLSLTPGWCNLTLKCVLTRTREDLTVSWESECLPRELEQRPAPGPSPNPWTLAVNLPLSQPSPSLTCVVSNQGDQKTVTLDLGDVCDHETEPQGQTSAAHLSGILVPVVVLPLILGAGLYLWKRRGKKKKLEPGRGAGSQEEPRDPDGGIHYAELSHQGSRDHRDKGRTTSRRGELSHYCLQ